MSKFWDWLGCKNRTKKTQNKRRYSHPCWWSAGGLFLKGTPMMSAGCKHIDILWPRSSTSRNFFQGDKLGQRNTQNCMYRSCHIVYIKKTGNNLNNPQRTGGETMVPPYPICQPGISMHAFIHQHKATSVIIHPLDSPRKTYKLHPTYVVYKHVCTPRYLKACSL